MENISLPVFSEIHKGDLFDRPNATLSIGCSDCALLATCKGLRTNAGIWDCWSLCCGSPSTCRDVICPMRGEAFVNYVRNEIGGFDSANFVTRSTHRRLDTYYPILADAARRTRIIRTPTAAVSLHGLFDRRTRRPKFDGAISLREHFRIHLGTELILDGIDIDRTIEPYWGLPPKETGAYLRTLHPSLVGVPNYSMFRDVPRTDNLANLRRLEITACELADAGLPVGLHVHGKSEADYQRLGAYLRRSPGLNVIVAEFATMGRNRDRKRFHAAQLVKVAELAGRPLTLVVRGGTEQFDLLSTAFSALVKLDTAPHYKAKQRQWASLVDQEVIWETRHTAGDEGIDDHLEHNIRVFRSMNKTKANVVIGTP